MKTTSGKRVLGACAAAATVAMFAGSAFGQNCSNGVNPAQCTPLGNCNGPDVIVGIITGPSNYTAAGGLDALSLGTTSCNIGNVWLNWFANTNQHPVIGGALYKYKTVNGSGRFEQIGQSWLKHGFFALSNGDCCSGCQSTNGEHLGVHCSDPYTSDRNGSQSGLGPKWQVNASTGFFTYPPASPSWSGATARRLEVALTDLEVSSASVLYFGESQYIAPDDATTGDGRNKNNNASSRPVTVTGGPTNFTFGFSGSTFRTESAIQRWKIVDPNVVEKSFESTGADRNAKVIIAGRATDLGGGQWHYEYAVYNMNSDRSIGSVQVPVPAGVNVTNVGFHDVVYRNGDGPSNTNFSGTDWVGAASGGNLMWATESFATNPSANAIRWGTTYNFRFDANSPPVAEGGNVTLGMFKPGNAGDPASYVVSGLPVPQGQATTCPADFNNDNIVSSQDIFDFLAAFFANDLSADFNNSGGVTSQDIFDFLAAFFTPCP